MSKVIVVLADGFEEIEAVSVIDILRRAEIETDVCGLTSDTIVSARDIKIVPDKAITDINPDEYDMIVLPGGLRGAKNIDESETVHKILEKFMKEEKYIAAICASPYILAKKGMLDGRLATCFPTFKGIVAEVCNYQHAGVVVDENVITSRGPATAAEFSFTLVELLKDEGTADRLREMMLFTNSK
ncbi:MAG: DJ-1 family glyoxalase III [Deferribacterales bacterium]